MKPLHPVVSVLLLAAAVLAHGADVAGSADLPDIGRFAGSEIEVFRKESYGATTLATGPIQSKADAETTSLYLEGPVTRIVYRVPPGSSALEVFRNFENRIKSAGYTTLFSGGPSEFDSYTFQYNHPVEKLQSISLSDNVGYLAAKTSPPGAPERHLALLVSPHSGGDGQRARLILVESEAMKDQMIDAEKMQSSLSETGKVSLYGIYFETDSATVQPTSDPTLNEITRLLTGDPTLRLIVVGHTDNEGGYDYNMDLSRRRAAAVMAKLVDSHGIDPGRLSSAGVGYLAPAASNETDEGRALNRRVELVRN